jgi:hypothetical protein
MKKMFISASHHFVKPHFYVRWVIVSGLVATLSACISMASAPSLIGHWQGELRGFPVSVVYTEHTLTIDGSEPVSYQLDGDIVTLPEQDNRTYRIEFPSAGEMVQIDEATGARQLFSRVE